MLLVWATILKVANNIKKPVNQIAHVHEPMALQFNLPPLLSASGTDHLCELRPSQVNLHPAEWVLEF